MLALALLFALQSPPTVSVRICAGSAERCAPILAAIPADDTSDWFAETDKDPAPKIYREAAQVLALEAMPKVDPNAAAVPAFVCQGDQLSCLDARVVAKGFNGVTMVVTVANLERIERRGTGVRFENATVKVRRLDTTVERACDARALQNRMDPWDVGNVIVKIVQRCAK